MFGLVGITLKVMKKTPPVISVAHGSVMARPRVAQLYYKETYWRGIEALRTESGLPTWAFDFISVHGPNMGDGKYSLVSPMSLVESNNGKRPEFENLRFIRKGDTVREARRIARENAPEHKLHVVVCP